MTTMLLFVLIHLANPVSEAEERFQEGVEAVDAKDYSLALAKFEAALSSDPDNLRYGSEYRQAVIQSKAYDRSIGFFDNLVDSHPHAGNSFLNLGFAYVDKIPESGAITQVILANTALSFFSKSLEIRPTWIGYYTRGNSYLYWPKIFGRTKMGVADLKEAMKLQNAESKRPYHLRTYISLGDGYWKMEQYDQARAVWQKGLSLFPGEARLKERLSATSEQIDKLLTETYDVNKRVDTDLSELWAAE